MIDNSKPMPFRPAGLCDAFDSTQAFPGACTSLANCIFDQSNPEFVASRPGVTSIVNLSGPFNAPTFICVHVTIGTRVYGMVSTSRFPGHDEPFCYDLNTNTFVPITGVTNGNTPTSLPTSGDWTPPTMASVGVYVLVTHSGFNGAGTNFFGVIDTTNPASFVWSSQNTGTFPLTGVPTAVANFRNRAYFAVGNQVQYTDVLTLVRTNASQALTIGDNAPVNALAGLPVQTTSSGVISSLTIFKLTQIWQVTGDTVSGDLALNFISLTIGTSCPRSIAQAPSGLYFTSVTGGPYVADGLGVVRTLNHDFSPTALADLQVPFQNAQTPTRWCGSYVASIYRVCGQTALNGLLFTNDYWFDEHRRRWCGPHTFAYDCASAAGSYWVLSSAAIPGQLLKSESVKSLSSVFSDVTGPYNSVVQSSSFPKTGAMMMKQVAEAQIELGSSPNSVTYTINALDEVGVALNTGVIRIIAPGSGAPTWGGGGLWGGAGLVWTSSQTGPPQTYAVPWTEPLVFNKMSLQVFATANANFQVGAFFARYQGTGYMTTKTGS